MAVSGSQDVWEAGQLAGKTLGVSYRLAEDEIFFQLKPGFYTAKAKSSNQVRDFTLLDATQVRKIAEGSRQFTRRQALSMVMGFYDPLGLASPALVQGKLLLRRLYEPQVKAGWDADLPTEEKKLWASWFEMLLLPAEATFPRSHETNSSCWVAPVSRVRRRIYGGHLCRHLPRTSPSQTTYRKMSSGSPTGYDRAPWRVTGLSGPSSANRCGC